MIRKILTTILVVGLVFGSFGGLSALGDEEETIQPIGRYERITGSGDLTETHVAPTASGLEIEGPSFTNALRIDKSFLESELGGWSASKSFSIDGNHVVFDGRAADFEPLNLDSDPAFTMGSRDQIEFQERPMWTSVDQEQFGGKITLDMDDGDSTGQSVFIGKEWLWDRGIHRPEVVHEDGTSLSVERAPGGNGWMIEMHHFTYVEITATDMVVFSRQDGLVAPHTGESRWYPDDERLEIDVGYECGSHVMDCTSIDQDVLVDQDWLDMKIDHLALEKHVWEIAQWNEELYYEVSLISGQTPTTLVYEEFSANKTDIQQYTAGNGASIFAFHDPLFLTVGALGNGTIELATSLPTDLYNHTATIGFNYTWLDLHNIDVPKSQMDAERVTTFATSGGIWYYSITDSGPIVHSLSNDDNPAFNLVNQTCDSSGSLFGDIGWSRTWGDIEEGGESKVTLTALEGTFCWNWEMTEPAEGMEYDVLWYTIWGQITDADNPDIGCSTPSTSDEELVVNDKGAASCEWPEGEPINKILLKFVGTLVEESEYENRYSGNGSWADCGTGGPESGGFVVAIIVGLIVAGAAKKVDCDIRWAEHNWHYIWNNERRAIHRLDVDENDCDEVCGDAGSGTSVAIIDGNTRRADTWDSIEEQDLYRDDDQTGPQGILWTVNHVRDAQGQYSADISIIEEVGDYDTSVLQVGATGKDPHMSFQAHSGESEFERTISIDVVNWEAPESVCAPAFKVNGIVDGAWHTLELGSQDDSVPGIECDDAAFPLSTPQDSNEDWMDFEVLNTTLSDAAISSNFGIISMQDVLDLDGNVILAMTAQVVSEVEFLDSQTDPTPIYTSDRTGEECDGLDDRYHATFTASTEGTSVIDGLTKTDDASRVEVICFQPLILLE